MVSLAVLLELRVVDTPDKQLLTVIPLPVSVQGNSMAAADSDTTTYICAGQAQGCCCQGPCRRHKAGEEQAEGEVRGV